MSCPKGPSISIATCCIRWFISLQKIFWIEPSGPGTPRARHTRERAHLIQAKYLDLSINLSKLLTNRRVFARRSPVVIDPARQLYQPFDLPFERDLKASAQGASLEHQRGYRYFHTRR